MSRVLSVEIQIVNGETWEPIEQFDHHTIFESLPDDWDNDLIANEFDEVSTAIKRIVWAHHRR